MEKVFLSQGAAGRTSGKRGCFQRDPAADQNGLCGLCEAVQNGAKGKAGRSGTGNEGYQGKDKLSLCIGPMLQNQIEKYRKCCVERLTTDNLLDLYDIVWKNIEDIIDFIEVRLSELQRYIDVFLHMQEVMDRNFHIVMNGTMPSVEYSTQLLDLSQRDAVTMRVREYLDDAIADKKQEALVIALEEKMLETQKQWMNADDEFNPMKVFVSYIEEQFKEIPGMTIEKFIELAYGKDNFAAGMLDVCEKLENNARVIYSGNMNLPLNSLPVKKYIVAPDKALNVVEAVEGYAKSHSITVAKGNDLNNIYWYNWICGVPLFSFSDIKEYERAYEDRINKSGAAGVHIYEGTEYDFRQLPDLYVYDLWCETEPEFNIREKKIVKGVKDVAEQLLERQIVYVDPAGIFREDICRIWMMNRRFAHGAWKNMPKWMTTKMQKEEWKAAGGCCRK